ncbi:hypothetical protein RvY_10363 [Ramazzottius varieornatus]|uniref:UBX domain-containing protein 4 n=1 Tax=Ramazzottius varieornatus TaxID=947166 RepID=A0A1D1VCH9_RAMVA|nr:hypothetical protein RvY_10363 [Ramazzottius varieornatus]
MAFYQKSVEEAIQLCKQRRGVLVVFIRNNNGDSAYVEQILEQSDVVSIIRSKGEDVFLIRIEQGTRDYENLHSIYPVASIPAIQFIDGANGLLLFTSTAVDKESFINDLLEGLDTWQRERTDIPTASSSSQNIAGTHQQPSTVVRNNPNPEDDLYSQYVNPDNNSSSVPATASTPDVQAAVARAQERIAEIRRRREKEAEAAEKEKEAKRRDDGQLAKAAEKQRQERLAEQTRQDMEKERRQDAAHRQKILDQLKQDKEDRARRIEANKESHSSLPPTTVTNPGEVTFSPAIDMTRSKIQFRFQTSDNVRTFVGEFEAKDLLSSATDYAKKETGLKGDITLRQMYPRKDFKQSESGGLTLLELGLTPTAVLIVVPAGGGSNHTLATGGTGLANLFHMLTNSVWWILAIPIGWGTRLMRYVFPGQNQNQGRVSTGSRQGQRNHEQRLGSNIHRRRPSAEDATYNGNSTQQL